MHMHTVDETRYVPRGTVNVEAVVNINLLFFESSYQAFGVGILYRLTVPPHSLVDGLLASPSRLASDISRRPQR